MAFPFRILWLDDEAIIGESADTKQWPAYLSLLIDRQLATNTSTNYLIQSSDSRKTASFCEVYHAPQFPQALEIIEQLEGKGLDCAILDVKLSNNLLSPHVLPRISQYLKDHNTSIEVYWDPTDLEDGRNKKPTEVEKDMWLVFWLYREIVSRFPGTPVLFYTNYKSSAEYAGMLPFMNPNGEMSPAIYDKADNTLIAERVKKLLDRRCRNFFEKLPIQTIHALKDELEMITDCDELLAFLTRRELYAEDISATLADLFPTEAMHAQKGDSFFLGRIKQIISDGLSNALPKHNYCSVYLRYCHPSTHEWSGFPSFGVRDLQSGYKETEGNIPDQWKSHFELLTHPTIALTTERAWRAAPGIARSEINALNDIITVPARQALEDMIREASGLRFPVKRVTLTIEDLKKKVRLEAEDVVTAIKTLDFEIERRDSKSYGHLYGCAESITTGLRFIADDISSNRKPSRVCIAFEAAIERPLWLALWGEFDDFSEFDQKRQIMLKNAHEGQKISGAIYQIKGFFHWYQFFKDHSAATWTELLRGRWVNCVSPIKEDTLFRYLSGSTTAGHLLVAEDYPPLRR
jgi:hypothetical protein